MDENVLSQPKRKTPAYYKAAIAQLLAEMDSLNAQMDDDRSKSERIQAETQTIKFETELIKERTAATLARLQEQVNSLTRGQ